MADIKQVRALVDLKGYDANGRLIMIPSGGTAEVDKTLWRPWLASGSVELDTAPPPAEPEPAAKPAAVRPVDLTAGTQADETPESPPAKSQRARRKRGK